MWKDVDGYPDYQVSNLGRVRSFKGPGGVHNKRRVMPNILAGKPNSKGYLVHALCRDGKAKTHNLHTLVLRHFGSPQPPNTECSHIDGVRTNCRADNLKWETHKENMRRKAGHGTAPVGIQNPRSVITSLDVPVIRAQRSAGATLASLSARYRVTITAIWAICVRRTWKHIT